MHDAPESTATSRLSTQRLRSLGLDLGLSAVGVTDASVLNPANSVIEMRKQAGLAGSMQFTYRNPERSSTPQQRMPSARSLLVAALRYPSNAIEPTDHGVANAGRIARYVWFDAYDRLARLLGVLAEQLRQEGHRAQILADTNHLVDRNVAWRAGIGWYGKNANLLIPSAGSWHVLGSILTDAELEPTGQPMVDGCGPCTRCIDDCPTDAIVGPGIVDANRCLAWLVQADGPIPSVYREAVADRIYGCDDCQEVCPPNLSLGERAVVEEPRVDIAWLLKAPDEAILERHGRWYIANRDPNVVRRTALVVLGNTAEPSWGRAAVLTLIEPHLDGSNHLVRNHAVWAARRLALPVTLPHCCPAAAGSEPLTVADSCPDSELHAELFDPINVRFDQGDWGSV